MTKILTHNYNKHVADTLYETVQNGNNRLYVYAGVHGDVVGNVATPQDDTKEIVTDAYRNMIFGKKVANTDVSLLVRQVSYEANKVFAMYDDTDEDMFSKDFYCHVDEGALIHTYKCLDNNFGANSTSEPQFSFVSPAANYIFQTNDGYVWKYMYSVSSTVRDKFETTNYHPSVNNANVSSNAVAGAIDVVKITQNDLEIPGGGKRYDNYLSGTWTTGEVRVGGNTILYEISNDSISFDDGFYTGCLIYLASGNGAGQHATINDYFHNANGNFIEIDGAFSVAPQNGTTWEITPAVVIVGTGEETNTAVARALVNSTGSNSIYKVEMLNKGVGYTYATANVIANSVITSDTSFIAAEIRPIMGPAQGHGWDAPKELGSDALEVSVKFANSESNTLLTTNRYQQIGIIRNPKFSNVNIEFANNDGSFQVNEAVYKIDPLRINSNVCVITDNNQVFGETSVLSNASVVTSGSGGSYVPEDILNIDGGNFLSVAQVKVLTTEVRTATINAIGSGYATDTTFSANIDVGTATTNATVEVTTNGNGECIDVSITLAGVYTANPPALANVTPVGGTGSGLTLSLDMGLNNVEIFTPGAYAIPPTDVATNEPTSNVGDGAGAELLLVFTAIQSGDFQNQLTAGDRVYLTGNSSQQLATVNSITNATHLYITTNSTFSCSAADMFLPRITVSANVLAVNGTHIRLSNVNNDIATSDLLVGNNSGAITYVNAISRNDVSKGFNTFIQMYKYNITELSNNFIQNEPVYQGNSLANSTANALSHSVVTEGNNTILYTSNQHGLFSNVFNLSGSNSETVATINNIWSPELKFGSGEVLYIENILEPIEREEDQSETLQIILSF